jgi:hypothetical protein
MLIVIFFSKNSRNAIQIIEISVIARAAFFYTVKLLISTKTQQYLISFQFGSFTITSLVYYTIKLILLAIHPGKRKKNRWFTFKKIEKTM